MPRLFIWRGWPQSCSAAVFGDFHLGALIFQRAGNFVRENVLMASAMTRLLLCAFALAGGLSPSAAAADAGTCIQVKNPGARNFCLAAREEFSKKRYKLALGLAQKALMDSPTEGAVRVEIARILLRLEGQAQAERELRQARLDGARDLDALPLLFEAMYHHVLRGESGMQDAAALVDQHLSILLEGLEKRA